MPVEVRTVPAASVATELDFPFEPLDTLSHELPLSSEQARYQPRFRVVTRKPLPTRRPIRVSPFSRAMALGAIPALALLAYVLSWTVVMYAGYQVSSLGNDIQRLQIERAELQTQKRQLQATGRILNLAETRLGMRPAVRRQFVQVPSQSLPKQP